MDTHLLERTKVSRAKRLKARSHSTHERLDTRVMAGRPFESRERYGRFLAVQCSFHRDIDALYDDPRLDALLPNLAGRRRLKLIEKDLADLGLAPPADDGFPPLGAGVDLPTALGWLYVAEGSNLGAAFLLKEAVKMGLSEEFGARHLAGHPDGRGLHWRTFTAALDAIPLDAEEEERLMLGATASFHRVHALVDVAFA